MTLISIFTSINKYRFVRIYFHNKMEKNNKSMFWSCTIMCLAIILYSVVRLLPFADQQECPTVDQYKELKGKEYIQRTQLDKCKASLVTNFNELDEHFTNRVTECHSLYVRLTEELEDNREKKAQMNTLCDENVCQNELAKCKEKEVDSTVESILNLIIV